MDDLKIDRTRPPKRRTGLWAGLAVVLLLALAAGVYGWFQLHPGVAQVRTYTVKQTRTAGSPVLLNASGYVTPRREATVSAKVTGKIVEVLVEEGMRVKEGDLLARLDASNVEANLRLAEAQLTAAQSALAETKVRIEEAERELGRITALAEERIATQADLDRAAAEVNSLKARLEKQEVDVVVAERQVALMQQQMEDMMIRAPFDGVVVSKDAQPGEMVSPISAGGGFTRTGICTIVDMTSLEIEVDVGESYINRVSPGQPVTATLDAYPDWKIPARVIAIIPTADRQKATVRVRVGFEELDPRILPQMGVKVAFESRETAGSEQRGVSVPTRAVRQSGKGEVVWVVVNGTVEERPVALGGERGDETLVLAGLAPGEKVIVEGPAGLAAGDRVEETKK